MRRLSRDSVRYHFPLLIGKFIRGCLYVAATFSRRSCRCGVFGRAVIIHGRWRARVCLRARARNDSHRACDSPPYDHSIRYNRSRLYSGIAAVSQRSIVSAELTNGPLALPGFRRVINDIISARPAAAFVFKFT